MKKKCSIQFFFPESEKNVVVNFFFPESSIKPHLSGRLWIGLEAPHELGQLPVPEGALQGAVVLHQRRQSGERNHLFKLNPFMPTVPTFAVRETDVSRHNRGSSGAPLKPPRDDSVLRALSSLRGLRGAPEVPPCWTANVGTVGQNGF